MKTFIVPADIEIVNPITKEKMTKKSFRDVAFESWLNDPQAINTLRGESAIVKKRRWQKVCDTIDNYGQAGQAINLEDQDYQTLRQCIETPSLPCPYIASVAIQFLPFEEAILNATDTKI